jgi:hypothetical protein
MEEFSPRPKLRSKQLTISYDELFGFFRNSVPGYSARYHETTSKVVEPLPIKIVLALIKTVNHRWSEEASKRSGNILADFYSDEMLGYSLSEHVSMFAEVYAQSDDVYVQDLMEQFLEYFHLNQAFNAIGDITQRIENAISGVAYYSMAAREMMHREKTRLEDPCVFCRRNMSEIHDSITNSLLRIEKWIVERETSETQW